MSCSRSSPTLCLTSGCVTSMTGMIVRAGWSSLQCSQSWPPAVPGESRDDVFVLPLRPGVDRAQIGDEVVGLLVGQLGAPRRHVRRAADRLAAAADDQTEVVV